MIAGTIFGSHFDKIFRSEWRHENAASLLSTAEKGGNDVQILGLFKDEFHKENMHFKGWYYSKWNVFITIDKNIRVLDLPSTLI